jgi:hypothetical protein
MKLKNVRNEPKRRKVGRRKNEKYLSILQVK